MEIHSYADTRTLVTENGLFSFSISFTFLFFLPSPQASGSKLVTSFTIWKREKKPLDPISLANSFRISESNYSNWIFLAFGVNSKEKVYRNDDRFGLIWLSAQNEALENRTGLRKKCKWGDNGVQEKLGGDFIFNLFYA